MPTKCLDCTILRAIALTFINKEGLTDKFTEYAINLLADDVHMSLEDISAFLTRMKEAQE